jgi:hypothetical protein
MPIFDIRLLSACGYTSTLIYRGTRARHANVAFCVLRLFGRGGGAESRKMILLWAKLKSLWQKRAARAAYRRLFQGGRLRKRAF